MKTLKTFVSWCRYFGILITSSLGFMTFASASDPIAFDYFEYSGTDPDISKTLNAQQYRNPILTGFYPDPSICQVGEDYYLINSTFAYYPGLPVFHSRDLVNWEQIGHVIHRPDQLKYDGLGVSRGLFAPAINYHEGLFYVVCTLIDGKGNFVVTAEDPAGPWSDPVFTPFEGIDPSLFFDDDGRAWMVNNGAPQEAALYDGHRSIWIQEFDYENKQMIGPRKVLVNGGVDISTKPIWIEGPHLIKRDGWYYLSCAEGGTGPGHSQVIFRSKKVDGPYEPWENNPILTQRSLDPSVPGAVTCTGHADYVIGPDEQWWAVFLGVRPYESIYSPMGRETFLLPVEWTKDGWPMILPPSDRVPLVFDSPNGAISISNPEAPMSGNFSWRDEFESESLSLLWIYLRAPLDQWWSVDETNGVLNLIPRKETLLGSHNPSYLAKRIQHSIFNAEVSVTVPESLGVSAGLAVFQNESFHYFAATKKTDSGRILFLERVFQSNTETLASVPLPEAANEVFIRIESNLNHCQFLYSTDGIEWNSLANNLDAKMLTTAVAGGFVGATTGPHARID